MTKIKRQKFIIKEVLVEFDNYRYSRIDKFLSKPEIKKKILVFFSYSTQDSDKFQIPQIAKGLEDFQEIQKVYFWEEDMTGDMYEYMEKNIRISDYFILFCSENASNSIPVRKEWKAALTLRKKIIPVFDNPKNIPLLISNRGVQFIANKLKFIINSIYKLIIKSENL